MTGAPKPGTPEWDAYLAEGNANQARKRVGADVLLRDPRGRLLIVKPTYKPGWDLPGGMAEANESPTDAARRELREELGLQHELGSLLCVDWVPPHGPWDDLLYFIFDGGSLTRQQCDALHPHDDELAQWVFLPAAEALARLSTRQRRRAAEALTALHERAPRYLNNGEPT